MALAKKDESERVAVRDGFVASALASVVAVGVHMVGSARFPAYRAIPEAPKRIVCALWVLGAFSFAAHVGQAQHVIDTNHATMKQWERPGARMSDKR